MPRVLHPAAHDEPALYLQVFGSTYAGADAICYHTAAERRLVQRVHRVAQVPQIVLGLGVGPVVEGGRSGADILGIGDRPYVVSVGRVDEHKGSAMLARFFRHLQAEAPRPAGAGPGGPGGGIDPPTRGHRRHRRGERGRQVGSRARRPGGDLAVRPRVLLTGGTGGVGTVGARDRERHLRSHPRALRAFRRWTVVRFVPRVRGRPRPPVLRRRAALGARRPGPRLRRAVLPVAVAHRAATPTSSPPSASAAPSRDRPQTEPGTPLRNRSFPRWARSAGPRPWNRRRGRRRRRSRRRRRRTGSRGRWPMPGFPPRAWSNGRCPSTPGRGR